MVQIIADWIRVLNALMGLGVILLLFARTLTVWRHWSYSQKMVFIALQLYVIGNTLASIELFFQHAVFSYRIVFLLVANGLLLVYLAEPERRYRARLGLDLRSGDKEND